MDQPQVTAHKKYTCPACGAEAQWNPAKQALVCAYCGVTAPGKLESEDQEEPVIVEHDLVKALRGISDASRGWQAQKISVKCQSCQAISVFDAEKVGKRCDFCGSTALVPYEQIKEAFTPESLLPLKVSESQVRDLIRQWYSHVWFAPNKLKRFAMTDQVKGVYLPYWTFDAQVQAEWWAEAGYYYYTNEEFRDTDGQVKVRQVQHVRWEPSAGRVEHFFDDDLVPASQGVKGWLLRAIEPFPTENLVPYNAGYVSGWVVERYQIDLVTAAQRSRERMAEELRQLCASQIPGDTYRDLRINADYSGQTFKHILAPVWLLSYNYGAKTYQVVANGYTGAINGEYPKSWIKISLAVLLAIIVLLLVLSGLESGR